MYQELFRVLTRVILRTCEATSQPAGEETGAQKREDTAQGRPPLSALEQVTCVPPGLGPVTLLQL